MRRLLLGAAMLCAPAVLNAQNTNNAATPAPPPPPPSAIGPAQLRDFQLQGQRQVVAPPPAQPAPVRLAPPSPVTNNAAPARPAPAPARPAPQTTRPAPAATTNAPAPTPVQTGPVDTAPAPVPETIPAPVEAPPAPAPASGGVPWTWIYAAGGGALLILVAVGLLRRRGRRAEIKEICAEEAAPEPVPAIAPAAPAPQQPRPWLELALKAERATSTDDEAVVDFELEISNTGKASASNIRIDVKMFNAGNEQDREIGAFFRTAGRESTKCHLSNIPADTLGVIRGSVAMPREEMKALKLQDRYLFVPVLAVNALYDYGEERTGQTSKSYVVGRELDEPSEKMGAFRVDQGPRVWRTVGQRQHKLARRV